MTRRKREVESPNRRNSPAALPPTKLRIIGGSFRGRPLEYSGDPRTRPMKDNIREALFNLVGAHIPGKLAIDLFAGTGAIGLEALSRGAARAILIERHLPTARIIARNVAALGDNLPAAVESCDTFFWIRQFLKNPPGISQLPWAVFCSPPYELYQSHRAELLFAFESLIERAPAGSLMVVEFDSSFDPTSLPMGHQWQIRSYGQSLLAVWKHRRPDQSIEV